MQGCYFKYSCRLKACNFTKSNTPLWVFFAFFKLYKWHKTSHCLSLAIRRLILTFGCFVVYNIFSDILNMWGSNSLSFTTFWILFNTNVNFISSTFYYDVFYISNCTFIFWTYKNQLVDYWCHVFLVFLLNLHFHSLNHH